ncbi:MAG: right-handed parallel beta-helix repeat-containing protein [Bacteroidaceae bacterium]|nr:right-handed parallel beta-helix repeat-containing protein [Bacteroidaceae bacterium]
MKRALFTLAVLCMAIVALAAPKRIIVNTPEEFINALGSNREIVIGHEKGFLLTPTIEAMIESEQLKLFDRSSHAKQDGVMYEMETDGPQLIISGLKNLSIRTNYDERLSLEVTPRYANVLTFIGCENIKLTNLQLGHTEEGYCTNGVLGFDNCRNITIDNCGLFGCGTEGVELRHSENFTMTGSEIFHCSYHIMHIWDSKNVKFLNCAFYNNKEYEQVSVDLSSEDVLFDHCVFTKNIGTLFNIGNTDEVKIRRCIIQHDDRTGNGFKCYEDCIFLN